MPRNIKIQTETYTHIADRGSRRSTLFCLKLSISWLLFFVSLSVFLDQDFFKFEMNETKQKKNTREQNHFYLKLLWKSLSQVCSVQIRRKVNLILFFEPKKK